MTDDVREIRERIDDLNETLAELQRLGEEHDVPAVERIATRMDGTLTTLDAHVPPELVEED